MRVNIVINVFVNQKEEILPLQVPSFMVYPVSHLHL